MAEADEQPQGQGPQDLPRPSGRDVTLSSEASALEGPGSTLGPYKLLQLIGEGGFGVVYMAQQTAPVRRRVALKVIHGLLLRPQYGSEARKRELRRLLCVLDRLKHDSGTRHIPVHIVSADPGRLRGLKAGALAFAETAASVFRTVERYVEFPPVSLPALELPADLTNEAAASLAQQARALMGIPSGPVPNVVRLLEAHGVIVVYLDLEDLTKVDAFSHLGFDRPIVLLNPEKNDRAKSRFDAAHELGHAVLHKQTLLHRDKPLDGSSTAPRNREEMQADKFATFFLMPTKLVEDIFVEIFETTRFTINESSVLAIRAGSIDALRKKCHNKRGLARLLVTTEFYGGKAFNSLTKIFRVSTETMAIRLEELDLLEF